MLARVFILLGGPDVTHYPIAVNILSALMSAFTVLFLFWDNNGTCKEIHHRK
jgi:hypothetical protein